MMIDFINRKLLDMYRETGTISNWGYEDWLEKKVELNDLLLNGEPKVSFEIDTVKSDDSIEKEIEDLMYDLYAQFAVREDIRMYMMKFIYHCISGESKAKLVKNNRAIKKIEGEYGTYQKGMKLTKIFGKEFRHLIHEKAVTEFLKKYSMIIQGARMKDTVYISTLPEDIVTMSDNTNGWSSCMSTDSEYLYRMGVVEYMQSPRVAIAYTKSRTELAPGVDNKKWRAIIMLNSAYEYESDKPYMTLNIKKPYPFEGEGILDELEKYLIENMGLKVVDNQYYSQNIYVRHEQFHQAYVDSTYRNICFELEDTVHMLDYSLSYECPFCGERGVCSCLEDVVYCSMCDEYHHHDNMIYVEGYEYVCEDCFNDYFFWCVECGEATHQDDLVDVEGSETVCHWCADEYFEECSECGEMVRSEEVHDGVCEFCEEETIRKRQREVV